jgi:RimJ/RimL family protein N-acetyltransferase
MNKTLPALEAPRLNLRAFTLDDFEEVHSWAGNPGNVRYMLFGPNTEEQTREFLNRVISFAAKEDPTQFEYALVLKKSGQTIGAVSIHKCDDEGELGWILHRDYWKQGYGTEAARTMLQFGFETLKLRRIVATCDTENYGSYRVMENIGMRREGLFVQGRQGNKLFDYQWRDEYFYAILADEYCSKREAQSRQSDQLV